ncbi:Hypothetical Protein FCC1311_032472 [Hondaea fermentalgiana]|uniref:Protein kinase domain-containing protein n=1 Tax=Hondaea fermentalgiana TaxID=2315210 RepID=A0A2R5GGN6_9STRA|nr:Hypothetical Protein FCC1311_032472 [Hondaea fermentalgiana]|eukprot:GBG27024.1 Hypothetical Protein FCC1311_032472 [Hondaea fermentalgiana]
MSANEVLDDAESDEDRVQEEAKAANEETGNAYKSPEAFMAYATSERVEAWTTVELSDAEAALAMASEADQAFQKMRDKFSKSDAAMIDGRLKDAMFLLMKKTLQAKDTVIDATRTALDAKDAVIDATRTALDAANSANAMLEKPLSDCLDQHFVLEVIRNPRFSSTTRMSSVRSIDTEDAMRKFLAPTKVRHWATIEADVGLHHLESKCEDIKMNVGDWGVLKELDCGKSEAFALSRMSQAVFLGIERYFEKIYAPEKVTSDREEGDWLGARVDVSWTRASRASDKEGIGALSTFRAAPADHPSIVFLVHVHKAPRPRELGIFTQLRLHDLWERFEDFERGSAMLMYVVPIMQTFTYMIHTGLKYAVLSTTDQTWFLRRDTRGRLDISSPYSAVDGHEGVAARRAYFAVVLHALFDQTATGMGLSTESDSLYAKMKASNSKSMGDFADMLAGGALGSNWQLVAHTVSDKFAEFVQAFLPGPGRNEEAVDSKADEALRSLRDLLPLSEDTFSIPRPQDCVCLSCSDRTIVDRCNSVGLKMIFKRWVYDLAPNDPTRNERAEAAMQNERSMYTGLLREAQGFAVPFLIYAGPWAVLPYVLAITDEGDSLERLLTGAVNRREQLNILDANFESARAALSTIHRLGVVHGGLADRNIVIHPDRGAKIIDLESARESTDPDEFQLEMAVLCSIFNRSENGAALHKKRSWHDGVAQSSRISGCETTIETKSTTAGDGPSDDHHAWANAKGAKSRSPCAFQRTLK